MSSRFARCSRCRTSLPTSRRPQRTPRCAHRSKSVKVRDAAYQEKIMKYICFGYYDEKTWETMSESERNAMIDECFAYDDMLRKNGHFVGGEALQSARNATTLRWKNGKVSITDGPYAEKSSWPASSCSKPET